MASDELDFIQGYHNIKSAEARELLQPHMSSDGCYLLRPSSDSKGGVLCTICVTNRSKLVNYRLVKGNGCYYIHSNASFPSIPLLLAHYKTTAINAEVNTRLLHPVVSMQQKSGLARQQADEMYVAMERSSEESPGLTSQDDSSEIPGLHLYLPKADINKVMSQYLDTDGFYLVRPSATAEGQLTLAVSNGGKVMNFKIINSEDSEFYISARRRFPTAQALLSAYKTSPIRSKKGGPAKIFLLYPIPVDPVMEEKHKKMLEDKAARKAACPAPVPTISQDPLPEPWQQHMNQQYHKFYYYNPVTKESTWERPRIPPGLSLPPRANGHLPPAPGRKMRDRPLPVPPGGQTAPAKGGPPLPNKVERPMQNGTGPDLELGTQHRPNPSRERMPIPPLPTKEIPAQEFPPQRQPHPMSKRPPMPLPTDPSQPERRGSFPLPPKEDNIPYKAPLGKVVPPLPPKEDNLALPRKRIVEYEDIIPKPSPSSFPPPLPEKEANNAGTGRPPPLPPGRSQGAPPTAGRAPPPLPPQGNVAPPTGRVPPPLPTVAPPTTGRTPPPLPPQGNAAPPTTGRIPLPPQGNAAPPTTGRIPPPLPPQGNAAPPTTGRIPPPLPPQGNTATPTAGRIPPPLPQGNASPRTIGRIPPPLPPSRGTSPTRGEAPPIGVTPPLPTREGVPTPPPVGVTPPLPTRGGVPTPPPVGVTPPLPIREDTPTMPPVGVTPPLPIREDIPTPSPVGVTPPLPIREDVPTPPPVGVTPPLPTRATPPLPSREDTTTMPPINVSPPPTCSHGDVPPPPPLGGVPPPPPPPPMAPPPPSPAPSRSLRSGSEPSVTPPQVDSGSGRPFGAGDLQAARTLLRRRAETTPEPRENTASGIAGMFANAIDTRMMSIRRAVVDSESDESEFEDVDDDDWED